jgi:hypothetical protein
VADDNSTIAWRLDRIEETLRDLGQRVVSAELYARDRAELERDIAELRAQLAEEKLARKEADKDEENDRKADVQQLKTEINSQGTNWRQALYSGLIPGVLFLLGLLWQLKAGTGK